MSSVRPHHAASFAMWLLAAVCVATFSVIAGVQMRSSRIAKLETHLRVAHEVAILFAVVTDREGGKPTQAGFIGRLNHERHIRRVLDLEGEAVVPTSGLFEDCEDGLH